MKRLLIAALPAAVILWVAAFFLGAMACDVTGKASFYGIDHHGKLMANQRPFNMHALTAAMWDVPFNTRFRVTNRANGKSVVVTITDRGPARRLNRIIDLSEASFARLAPTSRGVIRVCLERL